MWCCYMWLVTPQHWLPWPAWTDRDVTMTYQPVMDRRGSHHNWQSDLFVILHGSDVNTRRTGEGSRRVTGGRTTTSYMQIREACYHKCASGVHGSFVNSFYSLHGDEDGFFSPRARRLLSRLVYAHLGVHKFLAFSRGNWGRGTAEITIKTQLYWVALSVQRSVHETDWTGTTKKKLWCWFKWNYYFNYSDESRAA